MSRSIPKHLTARAHEIAGEVQRAPGGQTRPFVWVEDGPKIRQVATAILEDVIAEADKFSFAGIDRYDIYGPTLTDGVVEELLFLEDTLGWDFPRMGEAVEDTILTWLVAKHCEDYLVDKI